MPLDFAFSVHTDIGTSCTGVLINNLVKPLNTVLKNGDQVQIVSQKNKNSISPNWLNFCITGKQLV